MVGLWAQALITCYEEPSCTAYHDPRIPNAIKTVADYLYANAYNLSLYPGAFYYNSAMSAANVPSGAGSDYRNLNQMLSFIYAWLFVKTGNTTYRDEADTVFQNGVLLNPVGGGCGETGKGFNECYRMSFDYIKWRTAPSTKHVGKGVTVKGGTIH
jgi:hypothetical protein